jgi:transcriptional regulator with XRE-family HTH domain
LPFIDYSSMEMFAGLGVALKLLRELRGRTQADVARNSGVGKGQLSKYESGKELPKLQSLERILRELGVSQLAFFYLLHFVDERARTLATADDASELVWAPLPDLEILSPDTTAAFKQLGGDLLDLHGKVHQDLLFRRARVLEGLRRRPTDG